MASLPVLETGEYLVGADGWEADDLLVAFFQYRGRKEKIKRKGPRVCTVHVFHHLAPRSLYAIGTVGSLYLALVTNVFSPSKSASTTFAADSIMDHSPHPTSRSTSSVPFPRLFCYIS